MQDIKDLAVDELRKTLKGLNEPEFRTPQILSWIYKKGALDFETMTDLPRSLRERLKKLFFICDLRLVKVQASQDGTKKFLFALKDKNFIEAVTIPAQDRLTGCISSQVGCKFACRFCASAALGFKRNLTKGEIIDEVLYLRNESKEKKLTHIVFMGIGEPLDNYENVIGAIRIINSPFSFNIGARRITISTCGIIPAIRKLAEENLQIELSVSLHAADDRTRSLLLPVNRKYPVRELIRACQGYIEKTNRQITFEYVLIKNVNSDLQNARNLSKILLGLNCKVNLIPANTVRELGVEPAHKLEILLFKDFLIKSGINVTLRMPRGRDIDAACGQLRLRYEKE